MFMNWNNVLSECSEYVETQGRIYIQAIAEGLKIQRGLQKTVVRIESMAGIWSFRLNFDKNLCLNYYSQNLVLFNFRVITPEFSYEFPWISMRRLVKPHANYCVDILKAHWLRPAFTESYRLWRVTLLKDLWLFMFEMHLISGITDEPTRPPLPS